MKKANPEYKITNLKSPENFNPLLNDVNNNNDNSNEIMMNQMIKEKKEKKVKINLDLQNKSALDLPSKKSLKKSILNTKKSFNKKNYNHLEANNKSSNSIFKLNNNIPFPKSSLNLKDHLNNKSFQNDRSPSNNKSIFNISNISKSFRNKGQYNKSRKNFLQLINQNNQHQVYNEKKCSEICRKDFIDVLESDSLNLIEKKLQNKILDMGKEAENELGPLEIINKLNITKKKPKLKQKKTKKDEHDGKNDLKKHNTMIHKNLFNHFGNTNLNISSSQDTLMASNDKSFFNAKNKFHFSHIKNNIYLSKISKIRKSKNKLANNIANKISDKHQYKINLMKSDANGRRFSINHFIKSQNSINYTVINRSKTALNSKRNPSLIDIHSPKNNTHIDLAKFMKRNIIICNINKFRILSHKKLVYDSLDDEELFEDAINDNFYLYPDDKFVLIIDSLVLFLTFWSLIDKPLNLVLNNCDIKNTITSLTFENLSNIFIDFLFICDLIMNFFKSYYNFDEQLITNSEKIFLNYIKGYFCVDFISGIPYYSILRLISYYKNKNLLFPVRCTKYYNHEIHDSYQIIELLKLIKLIKCISPNNIVGNYIINQLNKLKFFETWSYLLSSIFISLLILHLTACMHIFISSTAYPNWIIQKNLDKSSFILVYLSSIYFLITTVTSVGYGDIIGNSFNEIIFQIFLLMVGIIAYSWLISSISNYVKENNQQNEIFNEKISILNDIKLEHPNMTKELYDKIYLHLEYINLRQKKDKSSLIDSLPHSIKKPLLYEMYKPIIENFNFFKKFKNSEFVNRVISKLKPVLAVKNDLLLDQGEIIEDTIFVKQGRLSLEVKIDTDQPEKSIEKLLNEEYFFGVENNKLYQKNAFGGVFKLSSLNQNNQSSINKKNLYNLYSGNSLVDNIYQKGGAKSIITNNKGEAEIQKHPKSNINYVFLRILDIRKNEHFGALLMFLNKRSPLSLRVRTKKAELFFLKKIDAIEISTSYPNIWKRVNKTSFHNLKQIKRIMKKIIKHFCDTYGINIDFATTVLNNYNNITNTKINVLQKLNKKHNLNYINNINNMISNQIKDPRRSSLGVLNSQLKMLQGLPKNTNIYTTKTNFEKDIEELIPKSFERNNNILNHDPKNYIINKTINKNRTISKGKRYKIDKENPIDCSVSMIKLAKKETMLGYGHPFNKKNNNNSVEINNNNNDINNNLLNPNLSIITSSKNEIKKNLENPLKNHSNYKLHTYGPEETNNLIKFFGTPYYPEDINDEVYPGENFEIISQGVNNTNNIYEQEFMPPNNLILSYEATKNNNVSKIKTKLLDFHSFNRQNNSVSNNYTINNNYITNNVINNLNSSKNNLNLNISSFNLTFIKSNNLLLNKNKNTNINDNKKKVIDFVIFKNSFEIIPIRKSKNSYIKEYKDDNLNTFSKGMNNNNTFKIEKKKTKKKIIQRKTLNNQNIDFNFGSDKNINKVKMKRNFSYANFSNHKSNENDSSSDSINESSRFSYSSSNTYKNQNNDSNIFSFTPKSRHFGNSIKSLKSIKSPFARNRNQNKKEFKVYKNIVIKIKAEYENLNILTNGKIKSKKLQSYLKDALNKKLKISSKKIERLEEFQSPKKAQKSSSIKLKKHKTMAKKLPKRFSNNIKITLGPDLLKKTEVKRHKKPMISDIKISLNPGKKSMNSHLKENSKYSSNSSPKRGKTRKKDDEFLLDYVNRNIRDDNAVLNNPGQFYNGLFNNIMKKVTIKQKIKNQK